MNKDDLTQLSDEEKEKLLEALQEEKEKLQKQNDALKKMVAEVGDDN